MRPADAEAALRAAREARHTLTPFTDDDPALDEAWGYDVQALDRRQRVESGETVIGAKLGLTSEAKQRRMSVNQPIVGFLTDTMRLEADSLAGAARGWAQPRIEPEIVEGLKELGVDGRIVHTATGAAILGHPLHAIVRLSRHLALRGETLPEGSLILAGSLTDAVPLLPGSHYTIRMDALGTLSTSG